jgi:dCTP deaminase
VILTDLQIQQAIRKGHFIVDPEPSESQFGPTSLDLHVGNDIRRYKPEFYETRGVDLTINLDDVHIPDVGQFMERLPLETDGSILLKPKTLVIATTKERVEFPPQGKLAARVEGRSSYARLGLVIHMTAPTIHNTFRGQITLEIMNHGPIPLKIHPNRTRLCQLILERIEEEPGAPLDSAFQDQNSPLGGES